MLRHVVMWRLRDAAKALELKGRLEALQGLVPELRFLQVGLNVVKADTASDVVLLCDFDDLDALKRYAEHPEHLKVVEFVKQVTVERRAVDFESA